ncbi:50S ribosomal protein L21 [Salipiger aestuarii]|uniref:Large ribosomal subunit protein bL21 n=1 Tax=Salipiger aestuarii TaxID=568098 RepID=A0A327Y3P9_9RHOB|nr:50S ribosomal protein L21 [Salipiger aestuarii]EIE50550.1 50S ribosomal protein L21/unknown domain fusion protein [Citreicella sp. 357]KAB2540769.1 50S ribosomal protein L21 [Salipiger aestuarii]RAK15011.1 large subunit ribosomal protein L21 [Salipiger aestuarii]
MFAVMKTGGKQYKVQAGDILRVEKLAADAGETVQFNDILMLGGDAVTVGAPLVAGAAVQAEIVDQIKGDKVIHFVKRRRKHSSQRTKGHRQKLTLVRVTEILASGADATGVKAAVGSGGVSAAPAAAGDDLTQITGVGPAAAKKLNDAGITTYAALAAVDPETFEAVKVKPEWVDQAKSLA